MAVIAELELGVWLDESLPEETRRDVEGLCHLLCNCVADAVVCLSMFEDACALPTQAPNREDWQRDADLHRQREAELEAEDPRDLGAPDYFEWRTAILERARRDVQRMKWAAGGPESYKRRVPFIHARSFITALAQLQRALKAMTEYDLGDAARNEAVRAAIEGFDAATPGLKGVRDSTAHAEDRTRWRAKGRELKPGPVMNSAIHAPGGGALIMDMLNGRNFGGTIEDGTYAEVEVSDATVEAARVAAQAVFDALPWKPGHKRHEPYA